MRCSPVLYESKAFESTLCLVLSFFHELLFYSPVPLLVVFIIVLSTQVLSRLQGTEMSNRQLHDRAAYGDFEGVRRLLEGGADMEETDDEGMTALMRACLAEENGIAVYLVEHGANISAHADDDGLTALHCACMASTKKNDNLSLVKYLLEHGASNTERCHDGSTVLLCAMTLDVLQYLLSSEGGASITETDDGGNTALLEAAGH